MANTENLNLPLVQAAQAQKHVTVNEALVRLDGLTQLTLISRSLTVPPAAPTDGTCYSVPVGAANAWASEIGKIAIYSNGGWIFSTPRTGWRGWIADEDATAIYNGNEWVTGAVAVSASGATSRFDTVEIDHVLTAGAVSVTVPFIPNGALVFGITGLVEDAFTGTLATWELGVLGSSNRYGSGLGLSAGSYVSGLTGSPLAYYSDTSLELTATDGDFASGRITLVAHIFRMTLPS